MRDFPIDDKKEIGKKKQKVSSSTMKNMYEDKLREIVRQEIKTIQEADLEKGGSSLPSKVKIYMNKFVDELKRAKLNRIKEVAVLYKVISALGLKPQEISMYIPKIKKEV